MRYLSLDFFRGLTIALMIVVNNPGTWQSIYDPLEHADWHGCTPTDLVFPFFLFIVGVALWFSFSKFNRQLTPARTRKILRRAALIFLIGVALNAFPFYNKNWAELRILGVLPRIGIAYGLAAFLCVTLSRQMLIWAGGLILVIYWLLLYWGGGAEPYSLESNIVRQVDLWVLGAGHLWMGKGIPFDPEGLLSTLPAVVTVIMGYLAGGLIADRKNDHNRLVYDLLLYGILIGAIGFVWGFAFPINKSLWTSTFVLYTGGLAMIFLSCCIWALDIRGWSTGAKPFLVFGSNPLFAFVLAALMVKTAGIFKYTDPEGKSRTVLYWVYQHVFYPIHQAELGSLLYALSFTAVVWLVCLVLYKRGIFIKI